MGCRQIHSLLKDFQSWVMSSRKGLSGAVFNKEFLWHFKFLKGKPGVTVTNIVFANTNNRISSILLIVLVEVILQVLTQKRYNQSYSNIPAIAFRTFIALIVLKS